MPTSACPRRCRSVLARRTCRWGSRASSRRARRPRGSRSRRRCRLRRSATESRRPETTRRSPRTRRGGAREPVMRSGSRRERCDPARGGRLSPVRTTIGGVGDRVGDAGREQALLTSATLAPPTSRTAALRPLGDCVRRRRRLRRDCDEPELPVRPRPRRDARLTGRATYGTGHDTGALMAAPTAGGTPEALETGVASPTFMAVDADSIYWTTSKGGHQ